MFMLFLFLVQFTVSGSSSDRIYRKIMYVIRIGHDLNNPDVFYVLFICLLVVLIVISLWAAYVCNWDRACHEQSGCFV